MTARGRVIGGALTAGAALLCACAQSAYTAEDVAAPPAAGPRAVPGWTVELADDFDDVDARVWSLKDDTFSSNEDSFLRADNCTIAGAGKDGHALRLQGKQESVHRFGRSWDYTSCYATTEDRFTVPNYFRAEVRAKVPMEQGMWAAPLWFRPADDSGGEIDLVETLGAQSARPLVSQTIHTDYGKAHDQSSFSYPFARLGDDTGTAWHTYTVEKVPGRITMWVDGVQTAQWSAGDPGWFAQYYEAGKRWNLRVNLQIGGSWGGAPDSTTDWDRTAVLVDHVYVWTPTVLSLLPGAA